MLSRAIVDTEILALMTFEFHIYIIDFWLSHQTFFLLYKWRFDEVIFTQRCFHGV